MAYRRGLYKRPNLIAQGYRPSFGYVLHQNEDRRDHSLDESPGQPKLINIFHQRSYVPNLNQSASGAFFKRSTCATLSLSPSLGQSFCRYMSTAVGEGVDKVEFIGDVADVISDTTAQTIASHVPVANEVAIAAADCSWPVMGLQYLIDNVHQFTGFNWWASIMITTLLIRGLTVPLLINQLKATTKLATIRPHMEEIKEEMESKGMTDPHAVAEGQRKMKQLFKEAGVSPFTPLKGMFIQGPIFISFFFAISNMAEKVPSFKNGGAFWFTDLTTPDPLYALPILTGLTFLITVECNMQEGMEGNPAAATMKNVSRALAVLTVPFTAGFPKAIFCYWITSNFFSLIYGLVIKRPGVKKVLAIPDMPVAPTPAAKQSTISVFSALKKLTSALPESTSGSVQPSKYGDRKTSAAASSLSSSSSVLSQRIKTLEREVKGRKKSKKR